MQKVTQKSLSKSIEAQRGMVFLSFCRALDDYCDEIGVSRGNFSAARILHDAALNTVSNPKQTSFAQINQITSAEHKIPQLFTDILQILSTDGFLNTRNRMSEMSLGQVLAAIEKNSHKR